MHTKSKLIITIVLMISLLCISTTVLAEEDNFSLNFGKESTTVNDVANKTMGGALEVVRTVGTGIALIMLAYIGIKYMMASPDGKAELKKTMVIYVLGAVFVFAATNIMVIIEDFAGNVSSSAATSGGSEDAADALKKKLGI